MLLHRKRYVLALAATLAGACLSVSAWAQGSTAQPTAPANATPIPAAAPQVASTARSEAAKIKSTADHSKFEVLNGPFKSGPEVTKACLTCHTEASKQVHKSIHWTWTYNNPATGQTLGKKTVVNSFCGNLSTNEPRCTSCHAGYGWKDASFDFSSEANVDCLVCHDRTGTYKKAPAGAGNPPPAPIKFQGQDILPPDWSKVAKSVGTPARENCGTCHFYGGGGDGVKHGDIDSSLAQPNRDLDVHMDAKGLNFACETCHASDAHVFPGSRYTPTAKDTKAVSHRGAERNVATCESCHSQQPHKASSLIGYNLNGHTDKVACQSCHIPAMARGGKATKTMWDWSTAGKLKDGKPYVTHDAKGNESYASIKGDFKWEENVVPTYKWFDGTVRYSLVGDFIDPKKPVPVNQVYGSADDGKSRIWPFKEMKGRQAYDTVNSALVYTNVFGQNDTAFWTNFKWDKAIEAGMKAAGVSYSGKFDFVDTVMYWPLAHMVAPKEKAVECGSCHAKDGRLANVPGFYMPGRDSFRWLDLIGWLAVIGTILGVAVHAALRLASTKTPSAS